MRDFTVEPVDLAIAPFNAIRLLLERTDLERCLACVARALRPGAHFVFDVTAPRPDELVPVLPVITRQHTDPAVTAVHRRTYDRSTQTVRLEATFTHADGTVVTDVIVQRVYFAQELVALLHYNGFAVVERHGDYDRSPVTATSPQLVYVCARRSA
jgi:hypothetical protein